MIVNLTPHPLRIYATGRADGDDDLDVGLLLTIPPEPTAARLATIELGTEYRDGVAVELVEFGHAHDLPARRDGVQYVVSLVVAISLADRRSDLIVPYREVRNASGTVIGCRQLAQPV